MRQLQTFCKTWLFPLPAATRIMSVVTVLVRPSDWTQNLSKKMLADIYMVAHGHQNVESLRAAKKVTTESSALIKKKKFIVSTVTRIWI